MKKILIILIIILGITLFSKSIVLYFKNGEILEYNLNKIESIKFEEENDHFKLISGIWNGDKGIEKIIINSNGTITIICDNGFSWKSKVEKNNSKYKFYVPNPQPVMYNNNYFPSMISEQLYNMISFSSYWELELSENGKILNGLKHGPYVYWSGETIGSIEEYERNAEWSRVK